MGLSPTNMCNIERGKTMVTMKNLFKMQEIIGCSMREFFEDVPEKETYSMEEILEAMRVMKKIKLAETEEE